LELDSEKEPRTLLVLSYMEVWSFVYVHPEASFEFKKMYRAKIHMDHLHQEELAHFVHVTKSNARAR